MTYQARQVLQDCYYALNLLENEVDENLWRIHWAGALALLRAVGNVLKEVDGKTNPQIASTEKAQFEKWKQNSDDSEMFFKFIKKDRDLLLKEYEFNVHPLNTSSILITANLRDQNGNIVEHNEVHELDENIYRPILSGPKEGDDARDAYKEALEWWEHQLDEIDRIVSNQPKPC
ncbi:hypothetical protein [Thalassospira alkalitolerans]|uniref:hypothetical protein n=1 Tax=Thalassospira alkalitolerans TaxID=1293890 RepID=UPI003AA9B3F3